jgi:biopolymer transport protein ExbD
MAITSTEVLKKNKNLTLADAKNGKPADQGDNKNQIIVNVGWDGVNSVADFSMDGKNYPTAADMTDALTAAHQANPAAYVLVRADKDAQYSNISDVMNAASNAGISTVTFAVLIGGGKSKPAAADAAPQ